MLTLPVIKLLTGGQSNSGFCCGPAPQRSSGLALTWNGITHGYQAMHDPGPPAWDNGYPYNNEVMGLRGSLWPKLGDLLAARLKMPIVFYSLAWAGSKIEHWQPGSLQYTRLRETVKALGINGFTALLWQGGESDADGGTSEASYAASFRTFTAAARADAGWNFPLFICESGLPGKPTESAAIRAAQNAVMHDPYNVAGIGIDDLPRYDGVHLNETGIYGAATRWEIRLCQHFGW